MAAANVLDIWMRDCCAGFWGMVRRSGVTLPLFEIITSPLSGREKKHNKYTLTHAVLTRCMAELRGGCGSMSNWDGVCPTLWIWASVACSKRERKIQRKERKRETDGVREERESGMSVSIRIKVMGQCVTWQCKQTPLQASLASGGVLVVGGLVSDHEWVSEFQHPPQTTPTLPPLKPAESSKC